MFFFVLFHLFIQPFRLHAEGVRDLRQRVELTAANGVVWWRSGFVRVDNLCD